MAHLLRGKQAGVSRDLSGGIGPQDFAVDDVGIQEVGHIALLIMSCIVCPLWHQFTNLYFGLRPSVITPGSRN